AMWLGNEPIAGKTILIYQDEGLGDVIQYARYVPMVAALGARVLLLVDGSLVPLLSKMPEVDECIPRSTSGSATFDTHCGISSLPLAFGTRLETVPASVPYLPRPDEARMRSGSSVSARTTNCAWASSGPAIASTSITRTARFRSTRCCRYSI